MTQFTRIEVAQTMKETGMIPLFFSNDIELSKNVLINIFLMHIHVFNKLKHY